jgi:single-strand DNA-binding protein
MSGETTVTVVGNLTADPELRFTQQGAAVTNFTVASTPRFFDKGSNEWRDGEALFLRCSVWREQAENVAEHLHKGTRVIVSGQLQQQSWEDKEGNKRTGYNLLVQEIGPSMRFSGVQVLKAERGGYSPPARGRQREPAMQQAMRNDPWAGPPADDGAPPF